MFFCISYLYKSLQSLLTVWHTEILHILPFNDEGVRQVEDSTGLSWLFYCSFRVTLNFKVPKLMVRILQNHDNVLSLHITHWQVFVNCLTISSLKDSENYRRKAFSEYKITGMHTLCCSVLQRNLSTRLYIRDAVQFWYK